MIFGAIMMFYDYIWACMIWLLESEVGGGGGGKKMQRVSKQRRQSLDDCSESPAVIALSLCAHLIIVTSCLLVVVNHPAVDSAYIIYIFHTISLIFLLGTSPSSTNPDYKDTPTQFTATIYPTSFPTSSHPLPPLLLLHHLAVIVFLLTRNPIYEDGGYMSLCRSRLRLGLLERLWASLTEPPHASLSNTLTHTRHAIMLDTLSYETLTHFPISAHSHTFRSLLLLRLTHHS